MFNQTRKCNDCKQDIELRHDEYVTLKIGTKKKPYWKDKRIFKHLDCYEQNKTPDFNIK